MVIRGYDKILVCREILRRKLKSEYGKSCEKLSKLYKSGYDLDYCSSTFEGRKELMKTLDYEYQLYPFIRMIKLWLQTEGYVDKSTEVKDIKEAMNKVFGNDLTIPEKYRATIERLRKDFAQQIYYGILWHTQDIAKTSDMLVPGSQSLCSLKERLSDRSFRVTPLGKLENIHTNEVISFDDNSSIRDIILGLQKIAREESIDGLLGEESIRENLGIDVVSYEVAGLESIRQDTLNQVRALKLSHNQIPSKLPEDMEEAAYASMRQRLQEASSDIERYNSQIQYGDGVTPAIPYKTKVYHRQGWERAYK